MKNKIFIDTNFFIAFFIRSDGLHNRTLELKKQGLFENELYTSNYVIDEILTLLNNKVNPNASKLGYLFIKDNIIILDECNIPNFRDKIFKTFLKFEGKLSFTDSSIIEIMKSNNINKISTFDEQFKQVKNMEIIN